MGPRLNRTGIESAVATLAGGEKKVLEAVEGLDEADAQRPILINPIRGLEDASRF